MARRGGRQRDPIREKFWRRTIRQQQRIGLTVRAFCLREGLKIGAFRWWRQALARRDREPSAPPAGDREGKPTEAVPAFLPVQLVDLEAALVPSLASDRNRLADRPDGPGPFGI
jgi:hypothetical protein